MALNNAILYLCMTVLPAGHLALRIQVSHKLLRTQERLRLHKHTPTPDGHSLRLGFSFLPVLSPPAQAGGILPGRTLGPKKKVSIMDGGTSPCRSASRPITPPYPDPAGAELGYCFVKH